ncbi:MAG: LytTR family DNA-binding domain-containing protein [Betaproteobacteria bacterium]
MKPRALIAEDEPLLAAALKAGLEAAWPELEMVAVAPNGIEALRLIQSERPDVAFLDIRMPGLTGLEVAAELADRLEPGARVPRLVFVTAYDEFALKAFDLAAVDYLLKPVSAARLAKSIERLKQALAGSAPAANEGAPGGGGDELALLVARLQRVMGAAPSPIGEPLRILRAAVGNTVRMVAVEDVCYFQSADKYTSVVTREAELLIRTPLKDLLGQLPPERFRQIHRGTIVNLAEVASATRDESGRVSVRLKHRKESLPVSRVFADLFRAQ